MIKKDAKDEECSVMKINSRSISYFILPLLNSNGKKLIKIKLAAIQHHINFG